MPFIHPTIFWLGAGAVSVPVLIHLLNRRRFRVREWAAMQFLLESLRKNRRRLRLEELILLVLRCLAIFLLGLSLARFTGCAALDVLPGADVGGQTHVFILDDSYSMGQKLGGGTIFQAATADLAKQLDGISRAHKVAILLTSRPRRGDALFKLGYVTEPQGLQDRIRGQQPSHQRARLAEAMAAAEDVFRDTPGAKRLFLYSDFRRVDLAGEEAMKEIRARFGALREAGVDVVVMDYGRPPTTNLTLQRIEVLDKFTVAKVDARVRVTVRNNGPKRAENVEIGLGGRYATEAGFDEVKLPVQIVESIAPGETGAVEFGVTPPGAGAGSIRAALPGDDLPGDDEAYLALDVRDAVQVLVVDGQLDATKPRESESYFFAPAIDPRGDGSYGNRPTVIRAEGLSSVDFDDYDVVVLLDVGQFPQTGTDEELYPQVAALERYVLDGGGLMIFTGNQVNPSFYKGRFYRDGQGLCPLPVRTPIGDPRAREKFFQLDAKSIVPDSVMNIFTSDQAMVELVRFFAITPVDLTDIPAVPTAGGIKPARVLARFNDPDGSPAVVSRMYGRGNVLMFCTTASKRWNDWPSDPVGTYVVVIQEAVRTLARAQEEIRPALVGEPIYYDLPVRLRDAQASLKTPRYPEQDVVTLRAASRLDDLMGRMDEVAEALAKDKPAAAALRQAVQLARTQDLRNVREALKKAQDALKDVEAGATAATGANALANVLAGLREEDLTRDQILGKSRLRYTSTAHAGLYTLALSMPDKSVRRVLFARNVDPVEGQLDPGGVEEIESAFGATRDSFTYVSRTGPQSAGAVQTRTEKEYWVWALSLALALLALETFLAQRFGHYG